MRMSKMPAYSIIHSAVLKAFKRDFNPLQFLSLIERDTWLEPKKKVTNAKTNRHTTNSKS